MNVAERIKTWREWSGLSKSDVADAVCVSQQTIRNWENGKYEPTYDNLERLAQAVGINLSQFWGPLPPSKSRAA